MDSKFLKILWTINGIGILIILVIIGINQLASILKNFTDDEFETGLLVGNDTNQNYKLDSLKFELQHIIYDRPQKIGSTDFYLSEVTIFDKKMPQEIKDAFKEAAQMNEMMFGAAINVLFFKEDRSEVYPLLDRNAYIDDISFPGKQRYRYYNDESEDEKKIQPYIIYKIALNDNNGDNRINSEDNMSYYISNLYGKNFEKITPDTLKIDHFWFTNDYKEIYFEAFKDVEISEDLPYLLKERDLYYYNISQKKFAKFDQIETEMKKIQDNFINQDAL
jgi:hypothetical protein